MSAGRLEEVAALLGSHFAAAGEAERAVQYFEVAGDHATAAFANDEAVSTFRSALAIVDGDRSGSEVMARAGWTCEPSSPTCSGEPGAVGRPGRRSTLLAALAGPATPSNAPTSRPGFGRLEIATVTMTLPPPPSTRPRCY